MKRNACRVTVLLFALLVAARGAAQESPEAQPEGPPTAQQLVAAAYERSKTAESKAHYEQIVQLLDRALRTESLTPQNNAYARQLKGWAHNRVGEAMVEDQRESAALSQFDMAVELNPDHWKARHNRGVSFAVDGRLDEAIADFTQAIRLKPDFANAWFNRGEVQFAKGDLDAAVRDYEQALRLKPRDAGFLFARGNAFHRKGQYSQALSDYGRAIELKADDAAVYVHRGDAYTELGDYPRAAQDYERAIRTDNQLGSAHRSVAWLLATCPDERFRDAERAVEFANKAIELDGKSDYRYLEALAAAQASAGQYDEAVASQQKAAAAAEKTEDERVLKGLAQRLELYQQQSPYRQPRVPRQATQIGPN